MNLYPYVGKNDFYCGRLVRWKLSLVYDHPVVNPAVCVSFNSASEQMAL